MIKVLWLCYYNINNLLPELQLDQQVTMHSASWIQNLSAALVEKPNVELHIITQCPNVSRTQSIEKFGIHFHVVKHNIPFTSKGFPWYFPLDKLSAYYSFSKNALKIINHVKPDVLHVHGTEGAYCFPALKTTIPNIISIQGIMEEYMKIEPSIIGYMQVPLERYAVKKGKYFGCRTNFDSAFVKRTNEKAVVYDLPEAMNPVFFRQEWKPGAGLTLLFVGSITKRKGIEDLILALYKLKLTFPEVKLRIIGSGSRTSLATVNQLIQKFDLHSNVVMLGNRSPTEIASELSAANLFVLPTLMDNSPNCLAEAMAAGVPCIATRVGGIPSMVTDYKDGMLFEKHDVDKLVELVQLLATNTRLCNTLSKNAKAKALERHYPPNVADKYLQVYKQLIDNKD
jgi:glycosyltransferase involved in cell wall biosynthesis